MTKFKENDRVRVYDRHRSPKPLVGFISMITHDGILLVKPDAGGGSISFHPQQCRRLVKKERKRIWVTWPKYHFNEYEANISLKEPKETSFPTDIYEFVEVRKKK